MPARDDLVRDGIGRSVRETSRAGDDTHHLRGEPPEIIACLLVRDLVQLSELPLSRESGRFSLEVSRSIAREPRGLVRLRLRHLGVEVVVDQESPYVLVRVLTDQLLDVDAPVAEHTAFAVRLGDFRLDSDYAFEARAEVGAAIAAHALPSSSISRPTDRSRAAASTSAAAAASWTAMPTDLYRVISSRERRPGRAPVTSSPSSAWT